MVLFGGKNMDSMGMRIKQIRKEKKVTQKELSERVCVTQSYISRLELDKEQPTDMLLKLIALEFNVSLSWLKDGSGEMNVKNGYDYFERNNLSNTQSQVDGELTQLGVLLQKISIPSINMNTISIIQNLSAIIERHAINQPLAILIFEQITTIILSSCDAVEALDKKELNPGTLGEVYKILRTASEDNYNALMEIGSLYEKLILKS